MFLVFHYESFAGYKNDYLIIVVPEFFCRGHRVEWSFDKVVHISSRMISFGAFGPGANKFDLGLNRSG